jgi:hypothetical protein
MGVSASDGSVDIPLQALQSLGARHAEAIGTSPTAATAPSRQMPARRLPLRRRFQLTILGTPPTGVKDATGRFLDGAGDHQQGSNYVIVITDKLLVPPDVHKARKKAEVDHGDRNR